jgi:hypothetical protein
MTAIVIVGILAIIITIIKRASDDSKKESARKSEYFIYRSDYKFEKINMPVKGLTYRSGLEISKARLLRVGDKLHLIKEPQNPMDRNAVKVITDENYQIGYVPREKSDLISRWIDQGTRLVCFVSKTTGGSMPYIYMDVFYGREFLKQKAFDAEIQKKQAELDAKKQKEADREKYLSEVDRLNDSARRLRINQLRRNIERNEEAITLHASNGNEKKMDNAIEAHQRHTEELNRLLNIDKELNN